MTGYIIPAKAIIQTGVDLRKRPKQTWRDVVLAAIEHFGGKATLAQLYNEIQYHEKTENNLYWHEKIRQILETHTQDFIKIDRGAYELKV